MITEEKKAVLLKNIPEFIKDCGINYDEHLNDIWPSEQFLDIENRKNLPGNAYIGVHMFDYLGVGHWLEVYKIACDKSRESTGIVDLNARFYNMTGEQLEKSFEFFEKLLNRYGLSIYQEFSISQKYELHNECIRRGKGR